MVNLPVVAHAPVAMLRTDGDTDRCRV